MITLYHVNHGFKNCRAGDVFDLLPLSVIPGSAGAEAYEDWLMAFPEGISAFGWRHMTPEHNFGEEVPEWKRDIEWKLEVVRQKLFPHLRSRYQAFFGVATLKEAIAFRQSMTAQCRFTGSIWEIQAETICHRGDMRLVSTMTRNEADLIAYWKGKPLNGDTANATWECVVVPPVTMIRCVVPDDQSDVN